MVKCSSSSTGPAGGLGPEDVVDGVLVLGGKQYVHILSLTGVTGLVQRTFMSCNYVTYYGQSGQYM